MSVSAVSSTTPSAGSVASTSSSTPATQTLSYDDFLTLLMSELKNQDPTKPMDPSQMVAQLATVSEVGQTVKMNSTLSSMLTANSLSQAELLVGQPISSSDGSASGTVTSVQVTGSGTVATLSDGSKINLSNGANIQ
jgi:flagellar basal-body rod modification protein FlgD